MQLNIDIKGLKELKSKLNPQLVKKAGAKTLNDMSTAVRSETSKTIRTRYTLPAARVKEGIKLVSKAFTNKLEAVIMFIGKPPGLQNFKMKMTPAKDFKKGWRPASITAEVIKGEKKQVRGGFYITGKLGVFRRETPKRYPIERLQGPSVKGMFNAIGGKKVVEKVLGERMSKTFWRHYNFYRSKAK